MKENRKTEIIDSSRLSAFQFCPHSYYLDTIIKENGIPMSVYSAQEAWLRTSFNRLIPDERYVGEELLYIEDLSSNELQKYLKFKSPESFANAIFGQWKNHIGINNGYIYDREIAWSHKNQWWILSHEIKKACFNYYKHTIEKGLPILDYVNKKVAFEFDGKIYQVIFSEIRKEKTIGEQNIKKRRQKDLDRDWEITLQFLAYSQLARKYEAYRLKWGISDYKWSGILMPELRYLYYNLLDDKEFETKRKDSDVESMLNTINSINGMIEQYEKERYFPPNHRNCYVCKYNVLGSDNKSVCKESKPDIRVMKPKRLLENE